MPRKQELVVDRGQLVSLFTDGAFFIMYIHPVASYSFLLVHCGSLVSTLVLLSETECPVALQ